MTKEWAGRPVYAVSELVRILSSELEAAFPDLWVEGEIGAWKRAASGHCYFTLKDDRSALRGVLWRTHAQRLGFEPKVGMVVLARGKLSVYEASGDLQLYATVLEPAGLGALQMAFEQAKRRLMAEGLTDPARKRPIPDFPARVGIVTSLQGAALRDVLSVLRRRAASFDVVVAPALVQGASAPASLASAISRLEARPGVEVILLTRGGGSAEDLWAFNDEGLARRVAACRVPVISAVGHEVDTVLTDLTADLRAPTPSVAAELLTGKTEEARHRAGEASRRAAHLVQSRLLAAKERLGRCDAGRLGLLLQRRVDLLQEGSDRAELSLPRALDSRVRRDLQRLELCRRSLSPEVLLRWSESLDARRTGADRRLRAAVRSLVEGARGRFESGARLLHSLSPLAVLSRGYAAAFDSARRPVTRAAALSVGAGLSLAFRDGGVDCTVTSPSASHLPEALSAGSEGPSRVDSEPREAVQSALQEEPSGRE
jgi:exodeoxyribonuclease VII large subunit